METHNSRLPKSVAIRESQRKHGKPSAIDGFVVIHLGGNVRESSPRRLIQIVKGGLQHGKKFS